MAVIRRNGTNTFRTQRVEHNIKIPHLITNLQPLYLRAKPRARTALDIRANCFTNMPRAPADFVSRRELENELTGLLNDERHEIITLVGSGGIGKTTLSLEVLNRLVNGERFALIVWFSARDIELTPKGPKQVRPFVLDAKDLSKEYVSLLQPAEATDSDFDPVVHFSGGAN